MQEQELEHTCIWLDQTNCRRARGGRPGADPDASFSARGLQLRAGFLQGSARTGQPMTRVALTCCFRPLRLALGRSELLMRHLQN